MFKIALKIALGHHKTVYIMSHACLVYISTLFGNALCPNSGRKNQLILCHLRVIDRNVILQEKSQIA